MKKAPLVILVMFCLACVQKTESDSKSPDQIRGTLKMQLNMNSAPAEVTALQGLLSNETNQILFDFQIDDSMATATVTQLKPGHYSLTVNALNADGLTLYTGNTSVLINGNEITQATVILSEANGTLVIDIIWPQHAEPAIHGSIYHAYAWNGLIDDNFVNIHFPIDDQSIALIKVNNVPMVTHPDWPPYYNGWYEQPYSDYPYLEDPELDFETISYKTTLYRNYWYSAIGYPMIPATSNLSLYFKYLDGHELSFEYQMPDTVLLELDSILDPLQSVAKLSIETANNDFDSLILYRQVETYVNFQDDYYGMIDHFMQKKSMRVEAITQLNFQINFEQLAANISSINLDSVDKIINRFYVVAISKKIYKNEILAFTSALDYHKSSAIVWNLKNNSYEYLFDSWPLLDNSGKNQLKRIIPKRVK